MKHPSDTVVSPIRKQATDALRRARKLPVGPHRNDLRQLAIGLRWLEKQGRGEDVLRILVTGGPAVRGGGGIPQRIITISRSPAALRTTGAG